MPTFRSDSSAYTNLTVDFTQIGRGDHAVRYRCNWKVTTGSGTANGTGSSNYRDLYIYWDTGVELVRQRIKATSEYWYKSSTYSGSFEFQVGSNVVVTNNSGSFGAYVRTNATGTQSCIWTQYCPNFSISYGEYWSAARAPSGTLPQPNPFEDTLLCTWNHAVAGINNSIEKYELYYEIDGVQTLAYSGTDNRYSMSAEGIGRGKRVRAHVKAITQRRDNPDSGWSGYVARNQLPNTPTSASVPRTSYIPGETIRVSFANNGDPNNNLRGFEVATDKSDSIVATNASKTATYVDVDTTDWEQSSKWKFRVRAYDSLGARSGWSNYTAEVTLNTTPLAPSIAYPAAGSTVYNLRPRVLMTAGQTNDGPKHILCVGEKSTAADGAYFSCGANDNLESQRKVIYRQTENAQPGGQSVSAKMYDSFLYSEAASRSFQIAELSLTDSELTVPGMKIKAVHLLELQAAANQLRGAYGLATKTFTPVVAGVTKISNIGVITELQQALQEVIDRINGWDEGRFGIQVAWVSPAAAGGGVDPAKLRQAIEQLRGTMKEI